VSYQVRSITVDIFVVISLLQGYGVYCNVVARVGHKETRRKDGISTAAAYHPVGLVGAVRDTAQDSRLVSVVRVERQVSHLLGDAARARRIHIHMHMCILVMPSRCYI